MAIALAPSVVAGIIGHARALAPREACGLLVGRAGVAWGLAPLRNVAREPDRYHVDPGELLSVLQELDARGEEVVAVYHSHPQGRASPSTVDRRLAWPSPTALVIVSLRRAVPRLQAYRICGGAALEEEIFQCAEG